MSTSLTTPAFLLHETPLSNDSSLLHFLTPEHGQLLCHARGFQRSKQRRAEIDTLRLLSLTCTEKPSGDYTLQEGTAVQLYPGVMSSYQTLQYALQWLQTLHRVIPAGVSTRIFGLTQHLFTHAEAATLPALRLYARVHLLSLTGHLDPSLPLSPAAEQTLQRILSSSFPRFLSSSPPPLEALPDLLTELAQLERHAHIA
ncbi:recombination protein O N-terminal domain-containing protein [Candidatus Peribacteria bacterium]|nr:recombination protein O N-terminal domain-containing protein [Candidatus Peribacteria bacterium]